MVKITPIDKEKVKKEILQKRKNRKESVEEKFEKYKFSIPVILEGGSISKERDGDFYDRF